MIRLLIIPLAAALIPVLIPAVSEWLADKINDWKEKKPRKS